MDWYEPDGTCKNCLKALGFNRSFVCEECIPSDFNARDWVERFLEPELPQERLV